MAKVNVTITFVMEEDDSYFPNGYNESELSYTRRLWGVILDEAVSENLLNCHNWEISVELQQP